jgi:RNA polymerase sigma-70 factor (ECF subfamily)
VARDELPKDREIIAHLARGDRAKAATLALEGYGGRILGYFALVLRDEDAAEEVYARFSEDLWSGIAGFRGEARFRTWAFQVAHNALCSFRRDPFRRRGRRLATAEIASLTAGSAREPTPSFRRTTVKHAIDALRARLDPDDRALLALRIDQRLSWHEVALVWASSENVSEAGLRKRFERLKDRLRTLAREEGLLPDEQP